MRRRQIAIGADTKMVRPGGRPSRTIIILLAVQAALFLIYAFADGPAFIKLHIALSASQALGLFELWQPLTAPWMHIEARALIVNLVTLWFFGATLERWWGSKRFVTFFIVTGIVGMVAAMLVGTIWPTLIIGGSGGATMAMMIAFIVLFPNHLVFFYGVMPLKAKWLGLLLAAFVLIGIVVAGDYLSLALQFGGALGGLLFLYNPRRMLAEARVKRAKAKFKVIEGDKKDDGPKYMN